jgi:hypothetical protein
MFHKEKEKIKFIKVELAKGITVKREYNIFCSKDIKYKYKYNININTGIYTECIKQRQKKNTEMSEPLFWGLYHAECLGTHSDYSDDCVQL